MREILGMEDLPIGTRVITPTGRIGTVIKHFGGTSKVDHFQRVIVSIDDGGKDCLVTLQPHLLKIHRAAI